MQSHVELDRKSSLRHEESKEIQIESMKKSQMAAQQIQDQISAVAAQQAKTLDIALSSIMANAGASGRAITTYSEPAKARILASI